MSHRLTSRLVYRLTFVRPHSVNGGHGAARHLSQYVSNGYEVFEYGAERGRELWDFVHEREADSTDKGYFQGVKRRVLRESNGRENSRVSGSSEF